MPDSAPTKLGADALVALEEARDFLLGSIRDLDAEHAAGDLDDLDHQTLRDDYTARAAEVLRQLDGHARSSAATPAPRSRQRLLAVGGVVAVALLAGVLVTQASGRRGTNGSLTGLDVRSSVGRSSACTELDATGDADGALACFTDILDEVPDSVDALTGRGWLQVRNFDASDGVADLDEAIALAPRATAPLVFRAVARSRAGDSVAALADLVAFYANGPSATERTLADGFAPAVIDDALDVCIGGDTSGSLGATAVVECYTDVLAIDSENAFANAYLGWLLARAGQLQTALTRLDRALASDPSLTQAYVFRAATRASAGDRDGAEADLATFASFDDIPTDQLAAAASVAQDIAAGTDPLG